MSERSREPKPERPEASKPRSSQKPASSKALAPGVARRLPSIFHFLRRKPQPAAKLPHAQFSHTSFGVRSLVVAGTGSPPWCLNRA